MKLEVEIQLQPNIFFRNFIGIITLQEASCPPHLLLLYNILWKRSGIVNL